MKRMVLPRMISRTLWAMHGLNCLINSYGAGMNAHTMTGHRAAKYYGKVMRSSRSDMHNNAIQKHMDAVLGGSDFPDFLYACGTYADHHEAGEAAHWPPFQAAVAKHIRAKADFMSGTWSEKTEKLVAFLYGVSVHFASDEFWEGLSSKLSRGQGFTGLLASLNNASGMGNVDENTANLAGDFWVSYAMDESDIKPTARYFPVDDLVQIYHEYNYGHNFSNVTRSSLEECKALFDLGLWAEKEFGQFIFHIYAEVERKIPYVAEHVLDNPLSGIDDMAVWAGWTWERIARWLDNGPPANPEPRLSAVQPPKDDEGDAWLREFVQALEPLRKVAPHLLNTTADKLVSPVDPADPLQGLAYFGSSELRAALQETLHHFVQFASRKTNSSGTAASIAQALRLVDAPPPTSHRRADLTLSGGHTADKHFEGTNAVGYFGSALCHADFNGDGTDDLAIGAYGHGDRGNPQRGRVTIMYSSDDSDIQIIDGLSVHGRFGWALAAVDFNKDNVADLVVAAPEDSWNGTLPIADEILGDQARFYGGVYIYFGHKGSGLEKTPSVTIYTKDDLTGLGMSLNTGDLDADGFEDLLIGCPMSSHKLDPNEADEKSIHRGAIFGFLSRSHRTSGQIFDARKAADLRLEGPVGYEWFGQAAATARIQESTVLFVGAPGHRAAEGTVGCVRTYKLAWSGGALTASLSLIILGDESIAEFGRALALRKPNGHSDGLLAISSPASSPDHSTHSRGGAVHILSFKTLEELVDGQAACVPISEVNIDAKLIGGTLKHGYYGRLGTAILFADVIGDSAPDLILSAPQESGGWTHPLGRDIGGVYVFDGAAMPVGDIFDVCRHSTWNQAGLSPRGRFGAAITASAGLLVVASPLAGNKRGLENVGVVETFQIASQSLHHTVEEILI